MGARRAAERLPHFDEGADTAAAAVGKLAGSVADRPVGEAPRASEFHVRLKLSERAESTLWKPRTARGVACGRIDPRQV